DHKSRVVEILAPLYERSDDWRKLVRLNEEKFRLATERHEKVDVLRDTAKLWEERGGDRAHGFRAIQAAFDIDPRDGETRAELERLARALGAWEDLAESYEHGVRASDDALVRRELLSSLAKLYDERLDDPRRALAAFGRLAELDPHDIEPLEAMD